MSQYNKTVLTHAGLELAKRANAGQAKFGITRAVTSADDWSHKTVQDLEEVTTIPNIMQQGTIMDTEEVESNNSVIGVSLCFANKDLNTSYQIRIIGLYAKEEGQENDFLYAVTTAVTPEYMPDFSDGILYRFNMQMYLVIGKAQAVNVVINDGSSVTHGQLDKYKSEVTANLKKIENTHKEDMSHVVKSASINGGDDILPDEAGKLELVVPAPDLSKYVSLEQLTEMLQGKADITAIPDKTATEEGIKQAKELAKAADDKAQNAMESKADKTNVYTKLEVDGKTSGTIITGYDIASKTAAKETNAYSNRELVDQGVLGQFADAINAVNGTNRIANAVDVNTLTGEEGKVHVYRLTNSDNTNTPNWVGDHRGDLIVINYDGNAKTQLWFPVGSGNDKSIGVRYWEGNDYPAWNRIAIQSDIDDLLIKVSSAKNAATQANSNADSRLPLAGGSMNTNAQISFNDGTMGKLGGLTWNGSTDSAKIYGDVTANGNLDLAFDLGDDGSNHFSFRQNGSETSAITSDGHYTGTVDWGHVNGRPQDQINKINTDNPLFRMIINSNNWNDIFGVNNNSNVLTSLRINAGGSGALLNDYAAGIGFGGADTKGVLSVAYQNHQARITGGNGAGPVWSEDVAWKSDINDLRNQVRELRENQFEVQTFTDATAAANWEAQRQGKRMAIIQS